MENQDKNMPTGREALEKLLTGNERYAASGQNFPNQTAEHRSALCGGQHPFAVILGCSDSRVPPEQIFDRGLGDLFVVRVAGNVLDDLVLGSIEYATIHLRTPLIMVLGHSQCGAVTAAVSGGEPEGHISSLTAAIRPALDRTQDQNGDRVDDTARENAKLVAETLKLSTPALTDRVNRGKLLIVAAFYNLDTGLVDILE